MKPTEHSTKKNPISKYILSLKLNRRQRILILILTAASILISVLVTSALLGEEKLATDLSIKNAAPSIQHLFGTDWLGRDMFVRTIKGLTVSIGVGVFAALISVCVALVLGLAAATLGKTADRVISWLIDLFLSVPHLVSLILISFALGGGMKGIIIGIGITHWPSLARLIRAEVLQLRTAEFVQLSKQLGKSRYWIASRHMLPHLVPQLCVGFFLLFPHAILHEAAVTFIGLGLSPHQPAIGIILSESMRYLSSGMWWLAFFPGIALLMVVRLFETLGENIRLLLDPHHAHQ